jgi:DNA-binding beta-propeller fold protein YncE
MNSTSARMKVLLAATVLALPAALSAQTFKVDKFNIGGDGGTDYLSVEPGTGRVFISRGTHVMVVDGATGKVLGDIMDTPRVHGIAFAAKSKHGFTTNSGDSSLTMFDLNTLAVIKKIHPGVDGEDGIMYDDATDRILSINHSHPTGTAVAIDPETGDVTGTVTLVGHAPEGGVGNGKDRIYINIEDKNSIDVIDSKALKVVANWPIPPCDGPTGIALDRKTHRIFVGCSKTSVVVDAASGKVVAQYANGDGVDALGWDPAQKLIYIPAGRDGNVTVVHEDSPDKYTVVATVPTMAGAKTIAVDDAKHVAYFFTPEYGPAPAPAPGAEPPARGRGPRGPIIGAWFIRVSH